LPLVITHFSSIDVLNCHTDVDVKTFIINFTIRIIYALYRVAQTTHATD